ncbi:MAG: hypothetical protein WC421_04650 [Elusimicrobiales bacterium]
MIMKPAYAASSSAQPFLNAGLSKLEAVSFTARLWKKDASLWKKEQAHRDIINKSLGWLDMPRAMPARLGEINSFARQARSFSDCVVLGMGGSSLAPEVFARLFPRRAGWPKLHVLDSTDPGWVLRLAGEIDLKNTLFIVSSKSGGTVEPNSFFKYFWRELEKLSVNPAPNFIAITDKGTSLEQLALARNFRKVFINPSDIGGRFSALSLFGLVPAAVAGVDVKKLLSRAADAELACRKSGGNPGLELGAFMGGCALSGRDKMILLCPRRLDVFGLWTEQLVAESTGKEGRGIVPVIGDESDIGGKDRFFVHIHAPLMRGAEKARARARKLEKAGMPVFSLEMRDGYDLGALYFIWETATAAAGAVTGINPFDQPNVQEAKLLALAALKDIASGEGAPRQPQLRLSKAAQAALPVQPRELDRLVSGLAGDGDYAAVLAYLDGGAETDKALSALRRAIGAAATLGYGPRYLHSTGQLHKGGEDNGVFLLLTAVPALDAQVPGENYTFSQLEYAQARGDFAALEAKGRRVVWAHLGADAAKSVSEAISGGSMPKTTTKKPMVTARTTTTATTYKTGTATKTATAWDCDNEYVTIDHPKHHETLTRGHYCFRIGASNCDRVEISVDDQTWKPCRHSVGYWWHDWYFDTTGTHQIVARLHKGTDTLVSRRRRFKTS